MFNLEIRDALKKSRVYGYEVAGALGVPETSFSRSISRKELSAERKEEILRIIEFLAKK